MLRPFSDGDGPADALTVGALNEAQVSDPAGTVSQLKIPLKSAEPHLLELLNSQLAAEQNHSPSAQ